MRIFTDENGLAVNAISALADGTKVEGRHYDVLIGGQTVTLKFHDGPASDGLNGLTNEALLAILIHRTTYLNALVPCAENETAINKMSWALEVFNQRTASRQARGVEGTPEA